MNLIEKLLEDLLKCSVHHAWNGLNMMIQDDVLNVVYNDGNDPKETMGRLGL